MGADGSGDGSGDVRFVAGAEETFDGYDIDGEESSGKRRKVVDGLTDCS